jgi:hypothetical protein
VNPKKGPEEVLKSNAPTGSPALAPKIANPKYAFALEETDTK